MTLIDKEALLEKLSTFHPDYTFNITSFRNFIKAQPEVEPRKGKWIYNSPWTMKCNQCGLVIKDWEWHRFKYCPNCGAKMEESDG